MKKLLLLSIILLTSCVKSEYDDRYWHQVSIDPTNLETYEFLDIADGVHQFYNTRNNGDGYTFEVNGNITTIRSEYTITEVRVFKTALSKDYSLLPVKENVITIVDLNPNYAIRIYHN